MDGQQAAVGHDVILQVSSVTSGVCSNGRRRDRHRPRTLGTRSCSDGPTPIRLSHHIFSKGEWRRAKLRDHPRVPISIQIDDKVRFTSRAGARCPAAEATVSAIADTGAQSDLWSLEEFLACGFARSDLHPVVLNLSAANSSPIDIEGALFAKLSTTAPGGEVVSCHAMIYVSRSVHAMYLSYDSLLSLGLLPSGFPSCTSGGNSPVGHDLEAASRCGGHTKVSCLGEVCDGGMASHYVACCSCPQCSAPPPCPAELPFPCSPENNHCMKAWLLDRYAPSTFNTCPHRPLPCMEGPPIEIHVDPVATPKTCHTAAALPLHWQQRVHDDLPRDESLGVIERVPYGEPVTWCHRMVVTQKHDGTPRRTVDISPLNKFCKRETFATESPFHLARRIPKGTWKTVTDAWNGYHSVPLCESDRHLTTFITPFGRWRYTRAPQGFLSSGDGYNCHFDAILSDFERKERCVDDTIHYDTDLNTHWWRTIDFLMHVGQSGIVLNPSKFQFAERDVDFAGFRVPDATIEPLPKYLAAIRDFPTPTSTTDIRSWFGLVNQVANYAQLRDIMAPFKSFLSPRCRFVWSPELEAAFQASKLAIVDSIRAGVEIYDMERRTCLRPDWSRRGIGYFLLQQHCTCSSGVPGCCPDGWKITLAGSRFLSSAEQRYAAIEGEALAVAWGLEQTRYFMQGCDNLVVVTDHKPLVKILRDQTLDEITLACSGSNRVANRPLKNGIVLYLETKVHVPY
uniref:ribonuclease H n=1 Tax=Nothobranchius furzeri TaxID=105023 RepID=A0A1A7ZYR7_NOTFU